MRYRFTGAMVAMALAAAVSLTVIPTATSRAAGRRRGGAAPAPQARAAAPRSPRAVARRGCASDRIAGQPNFNGIWQAISTANWNLEDHSAAATPFWQLGAMFAIPAGQSVVDGRHDPVSPRRL